MFQHVLAFAACLAVAGCVGGGESAPDVATPAAPASAQKPGVSGALLGSVGQGLSGSDLEAAYNAELAALDAGKRRSWRGAGGVFGYVEVSGDGTCRDYTHVIYVAGHPRSGKGRSCRDGAGVWKES